MALLVFRTFGTVIVSIVVLGMYLLHRKKKGTFIKRKATSEKERLQYQKWEKRLHILAIAGLVILFVLVTIPSCLDIPYLLSGNLVEVTGEVTQGSMSGETASSQRRVHIQDAQTGEDHSFQYWGTGLDRGDYASARYLPHTEFGYLVE